MRYQFALFRAKLLLLVLIGFAELGAPGRTAFAQPAGTVRISQQALTEFTSTVERAVKDNDSALFQELIDWDTIKKNVSTGVELHPALRQKFWARAESTIAAEWVFGLHMAAFRGDFAYRRMILRNGQTQAIFRCIFADGNCNYPVLTVTPSPSGKLMIVDFEEPMVGISAVRDWRSSFRLMSKSLGDKVGDEPTPTQSGFIRQADKLRELEKFAVAGDGASVLKVYTSLSSEFQKDFRAKARRLQAAMTLDPGGLEHRNAVDDLLHVTKDPLTRSFILMAFYIDTGDIESAAKELPRVRAFVGPDGWLDCVFATACLTHNHLQAGRVYAEKAVRTEPDLVNTHMLLMVVAAGQTDYVTAAQALRHIDEIKPFPDTKNLELSPRLTQFLASQPYLQWKEIRFKDELEQKRRVAREAKAFFESLESK